MSLPPAREKEGSMWIDFASYSDIGGREVNEDSTLVKLYGGALIAAVADGLGDHGGGDVASKLVLETLDMRCKTAFPTGEEAFRNICADLNRAVLLAQNGRIRMKTTLAMVAIYGGTLACAHVGDSRAYYFHAEAIRYQSPDHSVSQLAVLTGEIKSEQIRFHEDRSRLLRSLGSEEAAAPDVWIAENTLAPGDAVLLCSDGFWEYVLEKDMLDALKRTKSAVEWLEVMKRFVKRRAKGKNDNNSAVTVRVLPEEKKRHGFLK